MKCIGSLQHICKDGGTNIGQETTHILVISTELMKDSILYYLTGKNLLNGAQNTTCLDLCIYIAIIQAAQVTRDTENPILMECSKLAAHDADMKTKQFWNVLGYPNHFLP